MYSIYTYNTRYLRYGVYPWILNEKYKNLSMFLKVRTRGYKIFFMLNSTEHDMTFILLINIKMPTIVGILTFISRKNIKSESLKAKTMFIEQCL